MTLSCFQNLFQKRPALIYKSRTNQVPNPAPADQPESQDAFQVPESTPQSAETPDRPLDKQQLAQVLEWRLEDNTITQEQYEALKRFAFLPKIDDEGHPHIEHPTQQDIYLVTASLSKAINEGANANNVRELYFGLTAMSSMPEGYQQKAIDQLYIEMPEKFLEIMAFLQSTEILNQSQAYDYLSKYGIADPKGDLENLTAEYKEVIKQAFDKLQQELDQGGFTQHYKFGGNMPDESMSGNYAIRKLTLKNMLMVPLGIIAAAIPIVTLIARAPDIKNDPVAAISDVLTNPAVLATGGFAALAFNEASDGWITEKIVGKPDFIHTKLDQEETKTDSLKPAVELMLTDQKVYDRVTKLFSGSTKTEIENIKNGLNPETAGNSPETDLHPLKTVLGAELYSQHSASIQKAAPTQAGELEIVKRMYEIFELQVNYDLSSYQHFEKSARNYLNYLKELEQQKSADEQMDNLTQN